MTKDEATDLGKIVGGLALGLFGLFLYRTGHKDGYKVGHRAGVVEGATDLTCRLLNIQSKKEAVSEEEDS